MKTLVVLTGPTGVGKTELSLRIAEALGSPVLSCDSRQIYREMPIGTAAPTLEQRLRAEHYFVGTRSVLEAYSAAKFETDVLNLLGELFETHDSILMTGGSMMYIDAVCKGIDDMPDVDPSVREAVMKDFQEKGLEPMLEELLRLDPGYYQLVDRKNPKRVLHGLELCRQTGRPYSSFRKNRPKERPFRILKICLDCDRKELYARIDQRVKEMVAAGLVEEASALLPHRSLNALNTVGYKEMFDYFDGKCTLEEAVVHICNNTHQYARKQLTWFRKDASYRWFRPDEEERILAYLKQENVPMAPSGLQA